MQVRLTESGQKALGFLPDRKIVTVTDERAFALMTRGFAAKDKGFMSLFNGPLPDKKEAAKKEKAAKKKADADKKAELLKKKEAAKKEKAVSKTAIKREKAVK